MCCSNGRLGVKVAADGDFYGVIITFDVLQGYFSIASCLQPEYQVCLAISWLAQAVVIQELVYAIVFREDDDGVGVILTIRVNSKY